MLPIVLSRQLRGVVLAMLAGALAGCSSAVHGLDASDYAPIVAEFRAEIPRLMDEKKVPGLAVAVVDHRNVLWVEGFGVTDALEKKPVTPATLFSVQSISKNFTAAAVLVAVQEGLVDLDTPISTYLPDFTVNSRFDAHPQQKITLRMLLSHRAGFTHESGVGSNFEPGGFEEHIRSISQTWLRFPVGQRYSYSNLGVDLAGWILQVRSGLPFHEYVRRKVLEPAGMSASTFDSEKILNAHDRAIGCNGTPAKPPVEVPMVPAGGLYSNAADMARWLQFHLNAGKVGRRRIVRDALYGQVAEIPERLPGQSHGYGLGTAIRLEHGTVSLNHGGGGFGFLAQAIWYPEWKLGIVMLTNSSAHDFQSTLPNRILDRFIEAKLGALPPGKVEAAASTSTPFTIAPERQRPLAGRYLYGSGGWMQIQFKEDRLAAGPVEAPTPFTFVNEEDVEIHHGDLLFRYRFIRAADGGPAYLVRMYDGSWLDYNDGPGDRPGPDKPEWERHVGTYAYSAYGVPRGKVQVRRENGYLYLGAWKLLEHDPGLFFTPHGEALDLRGPTPTWRNIRLERQAE
jgi:CubicO group peptidase (beta-lactamase class C family)